MKRKNKIITGGIVIIFLLYALASLLSNMSPYLDVSSIVERGSGTNVQVNGTIVNGSTVYFPENNTLMFSITDGKETIKVVHKGRINNYQEGIPVVVRGDYANGVFYAESVLVKCPSKYEELESEQ